MKVRTAIMLGICFLAASATASSASSSPASKDSQMSNVTGASFNSIEEAKGAYDDITLNARKACRPYGPRRSADYPRIHHCRRLFITQAVSIIDDPFLNSVAGVAPNKDFDANIGCAKKTKTLRQRGPRRMHQAQFNQKNCAHAGN